MPEYTTSNQGTASGSSSHLVKTASGHHLSLEGSEHIEVYHSKTHQRPQSQQSYRVRSMSQRARMCFATNVNSSDLKAEGIAADAALQAGYTREQLLKGGYTIEELESNFQ